MSDRDTMLGRAHSLRQRIEKLREDDPQAYTELVSHHTRWLDAFGWGASNDFLLMNLYALGAAVEKAEARTLSKPAWRERTAVQQAQENRQNTTARTIILVIFGVIFLALGLYVLPLLFWGAPFLVVITPIVLGVLLLFGAWQSRQ